MLDFRAAMKRVAVLLESSLEVARGILRGIALYSKEHGGWLLDYTSGGLLAQRLPEGWRGDGIIARVPTEREAMRLVANRAPKVVMDPQRPFTEPGHPLSAMPRIVCDNEAVGRLAAEHFLDCGFSNFAYAGPTMSSSVVGYGAWSDEPNWAEGRRVGYVRALSKHGLAVHAYGGPRTRRMSENWNLEMPFVCQWLASLPKPVAVFSPHDVRARQISDACLAAGLAVPYSVAILGVNNDATLCETSQPPLSSIPLDAERAGWMAAELLDGLMNGTAPPCRSIPYPPLPVAERDSSANTQTDDPLVIGLLEEIRETKGFNLRVSELADRRRVTVRTLENHCRKALGRSVGDVIREACLSNVHALVADTDIPFAEIARRCGQLSASHLAAAFRRRYGTTMTEVRHPRA